MNIPTTAQRKDHPLKNNPAPNALGDWQYPQQPQEQQEQNQETKKPLLENNTIHIHHQPPSALIQGINTGPPPLPSPFFSPDLPPGPGPVPRLFYPLLCSPRLFPFHPTPAPPLHRPPARAAADAGLSRDTHYPILRGLCLCYSATGVQHSTWSGRIPGYRIPRYRALACCACGTAATGQGWAGLPTYVVGTIAIPAGDTVLYGAVKQGTRREAGLQLQCYCSSTVTVHRGTLN